MRNFFFLFLFVGGLVLVNGLTFLYNKHFFNFIELSPTDDDVLLLASPLEAPYRYLMLAQQWPPSHCNVRNCVVSPLPGDFTIHGLWPDKTDCAGAPYTVITGDLLKKLEKKWPDIERGNNQVFWEREWNKHGTCSYMDQTAYFNLALQLKSRYNVLEHLVDDSIKPRNDAPYPVEQIRRVVKEMTGTNPNLNCNMDRMGNRQLHEVRICYDPYNEVMDCPSGGNCQGNVYFPLN